VSAFPILAAFEGDGFRFENPLAFALLGLIPLIALLKGRRGQQGAVSFSSLHILRRLGPVAKSSAGRWRFALLFLTIAGIATALARPQSVRSTETITESGIELIVTIDVSRSMLVDEEGFTIGGRRVNRLQAAKKVMRDFISGRETDRIGIVAFAGRPYLVSPITLDRDWLEESMQRIQIGLVEDGTAIGSALAASAKRLDKRPSKSKVIVLLTDGVNNAGQLSPVIAAKMAKTLGIKIYTIAVGRKGDYIIPTPQGPQKLVQEFDEETLREIARIGDGAYFKAEDTDALEGVFAEIDKLEKTEVHRKVTVHSREWFHIPASVALVLGLLSVVGGETFWRRFP
jgi:Ca-activated chloride channel family protein